MDKYVIRTPRQKKETTINLDVQRRLESTSGASASVSGSGIETQSPSTSASSSSTLSRSNNDRLKQSTIESLKRVVVVDDILRLKSTLLLPNQSPDVVIDALVELGKKLPSKQVLLSTKIGHVINKLRKHDSQEVAVKAKELFKSWKGFYKEKSELSQIEVRCDLDTENFRKSGRKLLAAPLGLKDSDILPEAIERETYYQNGRRIRNSYRRHIRKLVFTLKHQQDYGVKLKNGQLSVKEFVSSFKKGS